MFTTPPVILLLAMLCAVRVSAQEVEPRAYSASAIGPNFLLVGVGASTRTGADFTTVAVARQYLWFDRTSPKRPS